MNNPLNEVFFEWDSDEDYQIHIVQNIHLNEY